MKLCKNGLHEKTYPGRCRECEKAKKARYNASEKGKAALARHDASEKGKARRARYYASEKGKATEARYLASEKGKRKFARYEASRIRVQVAGTSTSIRVPPERKEKLQLRLAGFRSQQADEYREHFAS
jgi:hypothetical protein